jgi:diguanylate cyclase (GGDEF)-like protein
VLLYVDLDNMKLVNDNFGHETGDLLLQDTAVILRKALRDTDIIGRIGGDEFVALALGAAPEYTGIIVTRLMRMVQDFNLNSERKYAISLSLGIASFDPRNPIEIDELMKRADQAMYMDKRSHKDWARSR